MHALIVTGQGQVSLCERPLPDLLEDYILVRTKAVALNPTDWKHVDFEDCQGAVVGCDYAGIVEAVGSRVRKRWNKGDRVAGFVHGCNPLRPSGGAFAEYILAKGDIQFRVPGGMSFEAAATLGVGLTTVGQHLYQSLELPGPLEGHPGGSQGSILIYGGATATGSLLIQCAKLSGMKVLTTCSEGHRPLVYRCGADVIWDYHETNVGQEIRQHTDDALELVLDTVSSGQSAAICAQAIGSAGGCYNSLLDIRCPRADVESQALMAYAMIGEPYRLAGRQMPGTEADLEFATSWAETVDTLLETGRIHPHPIQVRDGGLGAIPEGLQRLREGQVRGCKLVYCVE
ncbi:hypothetical protein ASPZODRAFT_151884 [Penicilliopsis zonata CBS 506.65]|uniref:Enoyl reductase (ER) domain-containing protein n=1 Tax=Penicilliopsis zonata CBS 506.65 TaxID=1073090 RepID=A0A1L9SJY7_9EURO|nr:hypothetical protein ASPZODRAFT_151884 [Penicilliopsis zonata CBS 506.65]OJJ47401.1 hypothetical protein ASPZODRAFT_151884 [Penicilliopsis zonata CBS 506.65]